MSKATHRGTCQACGATQKLPDGTLSLHGYTKKWGFFSGICQGAEHLPFEQSKDLIEGCIARAKKQIEDTEKEQERLRQPTEGPKAYVHEYDPNFGGYYWTEVDIIATQKISRPETPDEYRWTDFCYMKKVRDQEQVKRIDIYGSGIKTLGQACTYLNQKRADGYNKVVSELRGYIKWQQERIKNWKPQPGKLQKIKLS